MSKKKDSSESDLRTLLKSAGYLENRLEGFLLKNLMKKGSLFLESLFTCLKIGIGIGLVMAIIFSAAIVHFTPAFLNRIHEILFLILYLWIVFAIALSLLSFLIGMLISLIQKYTRGGAGKLNVALITSIIVSVALFVYLSLWWIKASSGTILTGTGLRDLVALVVILIISILSGRLTFISGLTILARSNQEIKIGRIFKFRFGHLALVTSSALLIFAMLFFIAGSKIAQPEPRRPSDYKTKQHKKKLFMLAIDGIDHKMLENTVHKTDMKFFPIFFNKGLKGRLKTGSVTTPPVLWTTVSTGMNPVKHGIGDFSTRRLIGLKTSITTGATGSVFSSLLTSLIPTEKLTQKQPITSNLRRSKTFWNILNDMDYSCGVVNWWVSWPCEEIKGFIVSERLLHKIETGGSWEKEIIPKKYFERFRKILPEWKQAFTEEFSEIFSTTELASEIREAAWLDFFHIKLSLLMMQEQKVRLYALYLPGADIAQGKLFLSERYSNLSELNHRLAAIQRYYLFLDRQLSELNPAIKAFDNQLLLLNPGRKPEGKGLVFEPKDGVFLFKGDGVNKEPSGNLVLNLIDITPTLLYFFGFPQSKEMEGKPVVECFTSLLRKQLKLEQIETFGDRFVDPELPVQSQFSEKVLEQLRNLGYIN